LHGMQEVTGSTPVFSTLIINLFCFKKYKRFFLLKLY
jgi:hypothetical protein